MSDEDRRYPRYTRGNPARYIGLILWCKYRECNLHCQGGQCNGRGPLVFDNNHKGLRQRKTPDTVIRYVAKGKGSNAFRRSWQATGQRSQKS
jgi:hypothetical protein